MQATGMSFMQLAALCLCPPGDGVYTVNTAKERKLALREKLFGPDVEPNKAWLKSMDVFANSASVAALLGISSDCGGGILRGANWGPLFLRLALLERDDLCYPADLGDVRVIPHLLHDKYLNEATIARCHNALYPSHPAAMPVSPLSITEAVCDAFYQQFPTRGIFGIGGDHSNSYPLTKSYLRARKAQGIRTAIIHFDAHTDLLTERLGIDLCFGSWCTHILADLPAPHHLIQLGIRSSGKAKSHWESTFGVRQFWAQDIQQQGPMAIATAIIEQLKRDKVDELYVSFDIDALDASVAAATGTPEPDGLSTDQASQIIALLAAEFPIGAADMMEIAPFTDSTGLGAESTRRTLDAAVVITNQLLQAINSRRNGA